MGKIFTLPKSFKANIDRALHNLSRDKSTTLHPMTAIPLFYRRMFRGDVFDFGVFESILRSEPTFAPLLSNWRLQFEWYFDSDANRYGWIDNNTRLSSEEVMDRKHHTMYVGNLLRNVENSEINPDYEVSRGCILDYAGVAPQFTMLEGAESGSFENFHGILNMDFIFTYLNIIRNYHINNQFTDVPYITGNVGYSLSYQNEANAYATISRENLDDLFMFLRSCPNGINWDIVDPLQQDLTIDAPGELIEYYRHSLEKVSDYLMCITKPHGGLFCMEFEPDLFQNLLSKDQGLLRSTLHEEIVDGQSGYTIEQFRLKNHLQGLYDKIFVSGGSDRDLSRTIWGIESNRDYDIPELLCVHSEIIGTNLITSTTAGVNETAEVNNVPGSVAGNVNMRRGASRTQKFTAKTSGNLMCIVSLVPLVTYNENIERHMLDHYFMDEFTPDMARKGFESVPLSDYCVLPDTLNGGLIDMGSIIPIDSVVGKQVAWLREMSDVSRCHGEFSNGGVNYDWLLHRSFCSTGLYGDGSRKVNLSVYGKPTDFNYPFVMTDLLSPNFNLQVAFKCVAYRPVPRKFMPNLGY